MTGDPQQSRLRQLIKLTLPKEHGSWSLALEPLALGLLAAPSLAGAALAVTALAGFFLRRPLKLVLSGKTDPRRGLAFDGIVLLGLIAVTGLSLLAMSAGPSRLWPLMPAALAGAAFAWFDSRNEAREGAAELAGATAFGLLPAAFGILAGWSVVEAAALAAVMLARSVPTVLVVRTYLRRKKGRAATAVPAITAAMAGLFLVAWLVVLRAAPWAAMVFGLLLAGRAFWLLGGKWRGRLAGVFLPKLLRDNSKPAGAPTAALSARTIGMAEMALGAAMVLTVAMTWKCL